LRVDDRTGVERRKLIAFAGGGQTTIHTIASRSDGR
jgi:hypothetical protein